MSVNLTPGANGLPKLELTHPSGSRAEIYLQGAHLTSWIPAGGDEGLFLSRKALFEAGKPIRGGTPIVFPQFSNMGPLPKHGFVRRQPWRWVGPTPGGDATRAVLELTDTPESREIWPHPFLARFTVDLGATTLSQRLAIRNPGPAAISFTAALHTYLRVADVRETAVEGLRGVRYRDFAREVPGDRDSPADPLPEVAFAGEVDRVYYDAPPSLTVHDRAARRAFRVSTEGFADVVVWNPAEGAASLPDMEADEYLRMVCVEAAQVGAPVELAPGATWEGRQELQL